MPELSYVHGARGVQLLARTISALLNATAARFADRETFVARHQEICWTWVGLKSRVTSLACGLLSLGWAPGDWIGIWSPNNADYVFALSARARLRSSKCFGMSSSWMSSL